MYISLIYIKFIFVCYCTFLINKQILIIIIMILNCLDKILKLGNKTSFCKISSNMRKSNKPDRSEIPQDVGQNFSKKGWLIRGNSFYSKELFRHNINTITITTPFFSPHRADDIDVTSHHYFFRPQLCSSERCFCVVCVFKCIN